MEPAKIDWNSLNSVFVEDDLFEHINAPQWVDLSAPQDASVDDEAWFCRPDCNHPKTVEDFIKQSSKLQKSASVSEMHPLGDRSRRDANLKRRGLNQSSLPSKQDPHDCNRYVEDGENQNPNLSTSTPSRQYNAMKAAIKSSAGKKPSQEGNYSSPPRKEAGEATPRLRSTLSARNLFAGRDILNQISDFCSELKRLATRAREREDIGSVTEKEKEEAREDLRSGDLNDEGEKERKPLLEVISKEEKSNFIEKQMRKNWRADEAENIPISVDLKNVKRKEEEILSHIRTCPPSPQCFSSGRGPNKATTPLKPSRSKPPQVRNILQELQQPSSSKEKQQQSSNCTTNVVSSMAPEKEAKALDVFWFLKPCTLSN